MGRGGYRKELLELNRLRLEVVHPVVNRLLLLLSRGGTDGTNHLTKRPVDPVLVHSYFVSAFKASHDGHAQVKEDHVVEAGLHEMQRFRPVTSFVDAHAC